jgi:hypothetical protein
LPAAAELEQQAQEEQDLLVGPEVAQVLGAITAEQDLRDIFLEWLALEVYPLIKLTHDRVTAVAVVAEMLTLPATAEQEQQD